MEHYVGIDMSLGLSSLCMPDAVGKVIRKAKVASEPSGQKMSIRLGRCGWNNQ